MLLIGTALLSGEESHLQGLSIDLWSVSKGQKELKLIRPKGAMPCQVRRTVVCDRSLQRGSHFFGADIPSVGIFVHSNGNERSLTRNRQHHCICWSPSSLECRIYKQKT